MGGVALAAFFVSGLQVFRGRPRVGSIWFKVILLIILTVAAPLIGEIGLFPVS